MSDAWIVEHHPQAAANAVQILRDLQFTPVAVSNVRSALMLLESAMKLPELIMLGPDLPDGHGLEILKCLQVWPGRSETKIVCYATEPDTDSTKWAKELGADAVLQTKRFDRATLENTFRGLGLVQ